MRPISPALKTILASNTFAKCNLYSIAPAHGATGFFTDADIDVSADGNLYLSTGPQWSGAVLHLVRGVQVSTLDLTVMVRPEDLIAGAPWQVAARTGALKNARIDIAKAFMANWGQPAETVSIFTGYVSETRASDQTVQLTVVSDAARLNTPVPRIVFQAGCMRTLYDAGCKVASAPYTVAATVASSPTRYQILVGLPQADGFFSLGQVRITSGANAGLSRAIKNHADGVLTLSYPLPFDMAAGDHITVIAGCDKTRGPNGCAKFNNQINFQATPFVPPPETAI